MTAVILAAGLKEFARFAEQLPDIAEAAAVFAVNDTSRDAVPLIKRHMRAQINFPSNYLNSERLGIRRKATRANIEAVISGRDRPTSLARFAEGATPQKRNTPKRPIFVKVKTGKTVRLDKAFMLTLRNGNLGLAIRLPKGQEPDRAYKPVQLTRGGGKAQGAWLLYGPSVDQVMQGVASEVQGDIGSTLSRNFLRHFSRLSSG